MIFKAIAYNLFNFSARSKNQSCIAEAIEKNVKKGKIRDKWQ